MVMVKVMVTAMDHKAYYGYGYGYGYGGSYLSYRHGVSTKGCEDTVHCMVVAVPTIGIKEQHCTLS